MRRTFLIVGMLATVAAGAIAQTPAREQLARGQALWDQRLAKSAIAALEIAARDKETAAAAHEALGRIYTYKGWLQDNVMPGWHDEPSFRARAIAEFKAALAADPSRASAQEALRTAEGYAAAEAVDPAPPRPEIRALDQRLQSYQTKGDAPIAEILDALESNRVDVVVINWQPEFSPRIRPELWRELKLRYPHEARMLPFAVRWRG